MKAPLLAAAAALLALSTASAQAADFSGAYVGGEIGSGTLELELDFEGSDLSTDDSGLTYGAVAGYNMNLSSSWLVGFEARYGDTDSQFSAPGVSMSSGREYSLSGLIGYQVGQNWLLFGTLGYSNLKIHLDDGTTTMSDEFDGVRLSLGAQYAITDMIHLRATLAGSGYDDIDFGGDELETTFGNASLAAIFQF